MKQTGSHLHCAVLGSPWDHLGSVSVPLILRFTNSPFLWSRPPASAQGRVRVPGVKSGEILPGRLSLSHQEPLMPPHSCPCPLPLSLWLGLSLQILARGHEGHHRALRRHLLLLIRAGGRGPGVGGGCCQGYLEGHPRPTHFLLLSAGGSLWDRPRGLIHILLGSGTEGSGRW